MPSSFRETVQANIDVEVIKFLITEGGACAYAGKNFMFSVPNVDLNAPSQPQKILKPQCFWTSMLINQNLANIYLPSILLEAFQFIPLFC